MTDSTKIVSSTYDIQKRWLELIAPKYFNIKDNNMLKAGLFGYINEVMANSVEDAAFTQAVKANEIFPNRAVLPDSIYAYASLAKYDDFSARPSSLPFMLAVKKDDIIANADQKTGYKELVISRFSKLIIENSISFMIDYDIRIIAKPTNDGKDYTLSAQYVMDIDNSVSGVTSPYLQYVVLEEQGVEFIFIRIDARQMDRIERKFMVYSTDVVENLNFEADFEGKLAGFNVYYKSPNATTHIQLDKYFVDTYKPESKNFCFYNYVGENRINISFSAHPSYFKPEFNSELLIEIFVTQGSEGNFTYTGDNAVFQFFSNGDKDFSKILSSTSVLGDAEGGMDRDDISTIKQRVIEEFSSRGNLITDIDLNNYFRQKSGESKIYFTKKRDDLIRRLFSAFILLKDDANDIIPTNTVDLLVHDYQFDNYNPAGTIQTIKAGTLFESYDVDGGTYIKPDTMYSRDELIRADANPNHYIYGTPFLTKVTTKPHFVSYYLNSVFDTYTLQFKYLNREALDEFMVNNVKIERNAVKSNVYKIRFNLLTSLDLNEIVIVNPATNEFIADLGNLKVKILISEFAKYTGYFNAKIVGLTPEGALMCEGELVTDDYINSDDKLNLQSCVYSLSDSDVLIKESFPITNDEVKFDICIFYNGYTDKSRSNLADQIPGLDDYCLTNIYSTDGNIELFKNLNSIMTSTILTKIEPSGSGFYYKIKGVPVVRYLYLQNDENMRQLIKLLDYFKDVLSGALDVMENNVNIDFKFYNSFGPSKFFTIGTAKQKLNKTSIAITLNIKIVGEIRSILVEEIKRFIIEFVEDTNNDGTNFLYMSNLIRRMEENFGQISYMEFVGFNDYSSNYQIIENNFRGIDYLRKEQVINFIPEYLNVNRVPVMEGGVMRFEPEIRINFV